jgi:hypothetical protein
MRLAHVISAAALPPRIIRGADLTDSAIIAERFD